MRPGGSRAEQQRAQSHQDGEHRRATPCRPVLPGPPPTVPHDRLRLVMLHRNPQLVDVTGLFGSRLINGGAPAGSDSAASVSET
ncbi:hypothetical protein GCM10009661_67660 [Catellatospora chokoriensis]